jgi:ABC-type uncharacterized transport system substrate-binding protein
MRRRHFIELLSGAMIAIPCAAIGQPSGKVYHVGTLGPGPARDEKTPDGATLIRALKEHGYAVGKNLGFTARGAKGQLADIPRIIDEMRTAGVDVIVTIGYRPALAAKASGIPVVVAFGSGDPVATGLVKSLAHPGVRSPGLRTTRRLSLPSGFRCSSKCCQT